MSISNLTSRMLRFRDAAIEAELDSTHLLSKLDL